MSNYALCLCGHGTSHHRNGSGVCDDFCAAGARPGSCGGGHSCRCPAFSLWDQRSARNDFAKAALATMGAVFLTVATKTETTLDTIYADIAKQAFAVADAMPAESHKEEEKAQ